MSGLRSTAIDRSGGSPFRRPGWVISALLVAMIVLLALVVGIPDLRGHHDAQATAGRRSGPRRPIAATPATAGACGLPGAERMIGAIDLSRTTWRYQGTTAYPISPVYGPARAATAGYRYCYQHSTGGALLAAANTIALDFPDGKSALAWADYMVADGPYHDQQLSESYGQGDPSIRLQIVGYRIMDYTGRTAKIDLAVQTTTLEQSLTVSTVIDLVWQRGDWRYSAASPRPVSVGRVAEPSSYTVWGGL